MKLSIMTLVVIPTMLGCAVAQYNDGEKVVIEHDFFVDAAVVAERATSGCAQFGKARATKVAQANKGDFAKPGTGAQLSTFKCES